jgi:hypothetical protein
MSNKPNFAKKAAKAAVFTIGGGFALIALADTASADEVVVQDADVTNAGVGVANSGGNVAVGNASTNVAGTGQVAVGGIASNAASTSNESNGTATIETGDATGIGNQSETEITQQADADGGPGVVVAVQDSDVTNAGLGVANSGGNVGIGNASTNIAGTGQVAVGGIASNVADTSNTSDGTVGITTGDATGTGNQSKTKVAQDFHADPNAGLAVVWQESDVDNVGIGIANTGGNVGVGNASLNIAGTGQLAIGGLASNTASTKNGSKGTVGIVTGDATATGNMSDTDVSQSADVDPAMGPAIVVQSAPILNAGIGIANSGGNVGVANASTNIAGVLQISFGLLASNTSSVDNWSDGFLMIVSGDATGVGNAATTTVKQEA